MTNPTSAVTDELKPCPFCGGAAWVFQDSGSWLIRHKPKGNCPIGHANPYEMVGYRAKFQAIEAWNDRTSAAQPAGEVVGWRFQSLGGNGIDWVDRVSFENPANIEFKTRNPRPLTYADTHPAPSVEREAVVEECAPLQHRVNVWAEKVFPEEVRADKIERSMRFLEEATELCQSIGLTAEKAHVVVDYVFGRPIGEPMQEVGGVMVTLAVLCDASELDMIACGDIELSRIDTPEMRGKIAAKQVSKRLFGMSGPSYEALKSTPSPEPAPEIAALVEEFSEFEKRMEEECEELLTSWVAFKNRILSTLKGGGRG